MPDTPREMEQPAAHTPDDDTPVEKSVGEGAQQVVQEARKEVATTRTPWLQTSKRGYFLLGIYALLLVLFALLATFVHFHPVLGVDVTITREFQENQNPWLSGLMTAVSYIGYQLWLSIGLVVLAALIFWVVDLRLEAITIAIVYSFSGILDAVIKIFVGRPRPNASLVEVFRTVSGQSFPSGHVMSYVAFWGVLFTFGVILFNGLRWWRIALLVVSAFFVVIIGPSRIYLGAHWATDVLGAYLIEVALIGIALFIYLQLSKNGVLSPHREHTWLSSRKFVRGVKNN
ncbi:MAG TPA: phosphatase PAP2 family protein [Ktedonobacteraceae bacterium]|nr:phosphatase PAP2 family protein [Ktedonobacteraceae bacterium]